MNKHTIPMVWFCMGLYGGFKKSFDIYIDIDYDFDFPFNRILIITLGMFYNVHCTVCSTFGH